MKVKRVIDVLTYYVLPIVLLLLSLTAGKEFFVDLGEVAIIFLIITLFISPVIKIIGYTKLNKLLLYRRELGVATFWFFFFHAVGLLWTRASVRSNVFNVKSFIFWGFLAGIGMTILALTSNDYSMKLLKRKWHKVHLIAYPVLFLALLHAALAEGELIGFVVWVVVFIILKILQKKKVNLYQMVKKN